MPVSKLKHKHWNEIVALIFFAAGLLFLLGLVSYSATDPCFSVAGSSGKIKNYIGIIGSYLSDALLKLVGISAYFLPFYLFAYAVFFALGREAVHPLLKKIGGLILFLSTTALLSLQGETISLFGEAVPSGGMLGGFLPS
jgi:S-DNA-T family DNA segregation ATPase FtsK/SpoIIIE